MSDPVPVRSWRRPDGVVLSTDPARLDFAVIHALLAASYWSPGVERDRVERAARNSLPYGLYAPDGAQIGYARVVTDRATMAYLADVVVDDAWRGRGLGTWMVRTAVEDPDLTDLRRWLLFTRDAHELYSRFGFGPLPDPSRAMVRYPASPTLSRNA